MELDGLITLADLPALKGTNPKPTARIVIGRLDDNLRDPRYGKFAITQRQVDGWKRNLAETFGGQVAFDFDHSSDRGGGTKAAAWVRSIDQEGKLITADVEFSRAGAKAVRNGEYKYTSPTFVENYVDEHGEKHGPALIGGALTNRPVLRKGMPTLSLSRDEFEGYELAKVSKATRKKTATLRGKGKPEFPMPDEEHARLALQFVGRSLKAGNITSEDAAKIRARANRILGKSKSKSQLARDSRGHMDLTREDLAKALGLDPNADTDAILAGVHITLARTADGGAPDGGDAPSGAAAAAAAAQAKAAKPGKNKKGKKAKALAQATGLDAEQLAKLLADANAGASAAVQLAEERFTNAWQKALDEGRAAPSQEANLRELHKLDPELAIKTLDSFVRIVPTKPAGSGEGPASSGPAPAGVDEERFQLHQEATALAQQKRREDPNLDEAEAYSLAVFEIEDRKLMAQGI